MTETIQYRFLCRRGTAAALAAANEVPLQGEIYKELDTGREKTGDGTTHYNDLPFSIPGLSDVTDIADGDTMVWDASRGLFVPVSHSDFGLVAGDGIEITTDSAGDKVITATGTSGSGNVAWNPLDCNNQILCCSDNAIVTPVVNSVATSVSVRANKSFSSGKHYFEVNVQYQGLSIFNQVGLMPATGSLAASVGSAAGQGWGYYQQTGNKIHNGTSTSYGSSWGAANNVIGCAFDLTAGNIWFSYNGTWQASGDPATGANPAFTGLSGTLFPSVSIYGGNGATLRGLFKASLFKYSAPIGFTPVDS